MKTPLGTEVDLGTCHIVLDVVPAVREWGTAAPSFRPCLLWPRSPISTTAELLYYFVSYAVIRQNQAQDAKQIKAALLVPTSLDSPSK